jgi:Zn finger protein HypA/HybF involved in hydrogenase expression
VHELGVVEGIREIVLAHARSAGASRILSVRVVVGGSSSCIESALAMFWDEVCRATEAAGARIDFARVPGDGYVSAAQNELPARRPIIGALCAAAIA